MHEITLDGVKKYMDATLLLKNITFVIGEGEKVGLVGENGTGKTTILKLIAGKLKLNHCDGYPYAPVPPGYDEGWVKLSKNTTCAYLEQIPLYPPKMRKLEEEMPLQEGFALEVTLKKYSELINRYEVKGGYAMEEKMSKICSGLKFDQEFLDQAFSSLSGGEKTTVILGKLLIDAPDVLLLDEPTNHLDMDSVEWLQEYIKNYKGIVVIVSHDRYFLDQIATKIIEIEYKVSKIYFGNYSDYLRQKEENLTIQSNHYKEQNKKIDQREDSIKALRQWAQQADNNKFYKRASTQRNDPVIL